jgi:hypothetical protein
MLLVGLVFLAIGVVVGVFYCLTLQKALTRCSPENRAMAPGMVWLLFIPLFNLVWQFIVVINVAKSLGAEFKKRNIAVEADPGKMLGIIAGVLGIIPSVGGLFGLNPQIGGLFGLGALVCFIIYWVKIAGFSNKLATPGA